MAHSTVIEENTASRHRLEAIISRLSPADLRSSTPYGWTVAALLAHLAFWDQRVLVLLTRWRDNGTVESPVDSQAINEALKPLCHAIAPRAAVRLCLSSAGAVDAEVSVLTPAMMERIRAADPRFPLSRAVHRNAHVGDIESVLGQR